MQSARSGLRSLQRLAGLQQQQHHQLRCIGNASKLFPDTSEAQGATRPREDGDYGRASGVPQGILDRVVRPCSGVCRAFAPVDAAEGIALLHRSTWYSPRRTSGRVLPPGPARCTDDRHVAYEMNFCVTSWQLERWPGCRAAVHGTLRLTSSCATVGARRLTFTRPPAQPASRASRTRPR